MTSPLALLSCIGVGVAVLSNKAAHARTVPLHVYRAPPTSSPTSTPSISSQPSLRPSMQHESYLRAAHEKPSSELWLIIYLTSALLCLAIVISCLVCKARKTSSPEEEEEAEAEAEAEEEEKGVGWHAWISSFWLGEPSSEEPSWDESLG